MHRRHHPERLREEASQAARPLHHQDPAAVDGERGRRWRGQSIDTRQAASTSKGDPARVALPLGDTTGGRTTGVGRNAIETETIDADALEESVRHARAGGDFAQESPRRPQPIARPNE